MREAVTRLTGLISSHDRYDYDFEDVRKAQLEAMDYRFKERAQSIKLLKKRAKDAQVHEIRDHSDIGQILFPHTVYKSYPEAWLTGQRWDKLTKWLDTISSYRVLFEAASEAKDVDDWVSRLQAQGFHVSCSSGTTGKSAMLLASGSDMEWVKQESVACYAWGSGVQPNKDRRLFVVAPVAQVPRNQSSGAGQTEAYQDPRYQRFVYPIPPITVGSLTEMVVLRKRIAEGQATPEELSRFDRISQERAKAVEEAVGITADALIEARHDKLLITGLWAGLYTVAEAVRERGYSSADFHPENAIYVGGGLKRAILPDNYQDYVYETFNIKQDKYFQNYSMQELHTGMPRCQIGGRYHLPPWLVPLIMDKSGDTVLPIQKGEYEGRAAFFDLSIDGRWGGVISGDKVSIDFGPCACGQKGPSIRDGVVRYADLEGDDKIGCAGTVDAYVRGIA